ncbi:hypothetical protein LOAG_15260 [Loa loa]|uniref:Uncharacterized protein n=1 Tax=Loa loa TaxID=7209 RepID=A0A1S0TG26_LOALO|nr:hypothetical protein LOAG_15260 [Loa loa]EFO13271.1 hypothetical protein LOAG_15260 [Loa loa]
MLTDCCQKSLTVLRTSEVQKFSSKGLDPGLGLVNIRQGFCHFRSVYYRSDISAITNISFNCVCCQMLVIGLPKLKQCSNKIATISNRQGDEILQVKLMR